MSPRDEIVKAARELDAGALGCARESARYERADNRELGESDRLLRALPDVWPTESTVRPAAVDG